MLKNVLLVIAILGLTNYSFGQTDCKLFGESGSQVNITGTIKLSGISKNDVYNKIATWGSVNISGMDGAYIADKELGIVKGVTRVTYVYKKGFRYVLCNIVLHANNEEFSYSLNNFTMNKKPMETYLNEKNDKYYAESFESICRKIEALIQELEKL